MKSATTWLIGWCAFVLAYGGGFAAPASLAQETDQQSDEANAGRQQPTGEEKAKDNRARLKIEVARVRILQEQMKEKIRLRDDQISPINKLFEEHLAALTELFKKADTEKEKNDAKVRELNEAMETAREKGDREEVRRIRTELRDLAGLADVMPLHRKFQVAVLEKLDEEQSKVFRELVRKNLMPQRQDRNMDLVVLRRTLAKIEQTPEQTEAIKNLFIEHSRPLRDARVGDPEVEAALMTKLRDAIMAKLTPEQVEKLKELEEPTRKELEEANSQRRRQRESESKSGDSRTDEGKADEGKPGEGKTEEGKPDEGTAGEP